MHMGGSQCQTATFAATGLYVVPSPNATPHMQVAHLTWELWRGLDSANSLHEGRWAMFEKHGPPGQRLTMKRERPGTEISNFGPPLKKHVPFSRGLESVPFQPSTDTDP